MDEETRGPLSPVTILEELKKERDLSWQLEMLGCFPNDEDAIDDAEFSLLFRMIHSQSSHFDLAIKQRLEFLKILYNTHGSRFGKDQIDMDLSITPWRRPVAKQDFAMYVVQIIKYENLVKEEKERHQKLQQQVGSPSLRHRVKNETSSKKNKMGSHKMDLEEDE